MDCKQMGHRVELASCLIADIILCNAFTVHSYLGRNGRPYFFPTCWLAILAQPGLCRTKLESQALL